jgi:cell division protease FtsH
MSTNSKAKNVVFWVVLVGVAALLWAVIQNRPNAPNATYSQFLQQVESGQISNAVIVAANGGANPVDYSLKDGARMHTVLPPDYRDALAAMEQKMVNIEIRDASSQLPRMAANAVPFFVLLAFWVFMMMRMSNRRDAK